MNSNVNLCVFQWSWVTPRSVKGSFNPRWVKGTKYHLPPCQPHFPLAESSLHSNTLCSDLYDNSYHLAHKSQSIMKEVLALRLVKGS